MENTRCATLVTSNIDGGIPHAGANDSGARTGADGDPEHPVGVTHDVAKVRDKPCNYPSHTIM